MTKNIPKEKYISNMDQVKKMHEDILKSNFSFEKEHSTDDT